MKVRSILYMSQILLVARWEVQGIWVVYVNNKTGTGDPVPANRFYFAIRLYLIRFGSSASAPSVRFLYSSYSVKLPSKNSTLPSSW